MTHYLEGVLTKGYLALDGVNSALSASRSITLPSELNWISDNFHVIKREYLDISDALEHLSNINSRAVFELFLPTVCMLAENGAALTADVICERIRDTCDTYPLSEAELWSVVPTLKACVIVRGSEVCPEILALLDGVQPTSELRHRMSREFRFLFSTLNFLATAVLDDALRSVSVLEQELNLDPAGIYPKMEEKSREYYRRELARLARRAKITEKAAAKRCISLSALSRDSRARHVGYYILVKPLGNTKKRTAGTIYALVLCFVPLILSALIGIFSIATSVLVYLPLFELVKNLSDYIVTHLVPPSHLPRMDTEKIEIPKSICITAVLLTSSTAAKKSVAALEEYRLASGLHRDEKNVLYGVLADLRDSDSQSSASDDEILAAARCEVARLNEKWGGGFFLAVRGRLYNPTHNTYMGWERKRGAIVELVRTVMGKSTIFDLTGISREELCGASYLITLDSDTRPEIGAVSDLIGAMCHPLNHAVIDPIRGVVSDGHGLIQPRCGVELESAGASIFTAIFAGQGGGDPYSQAVSDVYEDLYGKGSFTGKGILDISAFYKLLDVRFPENHVLSHDLLEGCYLRAGFMGDTVLFDGHPYKLSAYYDRQHRWIRGDWQLLPWLMPKVPTLRSKESNPLCALDKFRILDNLRRSLMPALMTALFVWVFLAPDSGAALSSLIVACGTFLSVLMTDACDLLRRSRFTRQKYHSTIVYGPSGGVLRLFLRFILLPYGAYVSICAIVTSLFRMATGKNMLRWVTAAESEGRGRNDILYYLRRMWFSVAIGALCILTGNILAFVGALWILSPIAAYFISQPIEHTEKLSPDEKNYLTVQAERMYGYFRDFLTKDNHYLPPDNFQEHPYLGLARRTSPTNIGLALLSVVSAVDLGIESKAAAQTLLRHMLLSIDELPKFDGHLYNWYDTETARPLNPLWISTVDCGNYTACLYTLLSALREWDNEYLVKLTQKLIDSSDYSLLYDRGRRLLYLGYDTVRKCPTEAWYDMLASEARIASYVAICRGEITPKHWQRLGRTLTEYGSYRGLISWTGTMFEYTMPSLLMPIYENSLLYESMRLCLRCQSDVRRNEGIPFGISESGFFAFDGHMAYRYKAHGIQELAVKRNMDKERVLSPYSAFLALLISPRTAIENLVCYEDLPMTGKYGYYEAFDMTKGRIPLKSDHAVVASYMVHHLGMSILSITNVLCESVMQRRFMANAEIGAFRGLLKEKIPINTPVLPTEKEIDSMPRITCRDCFNIDGSRYDMWMPRTCILSNSAYRLLVTDTGLSRSCGGKIMLTSFDSRQYGGGMSFLLRQGKELSGLTPFPFYDSKIGYKSRFDGETAKIFAACDSFSSEVISAVSASYAGELRKIKVKNTTDHDVAWEIIVYLEPVLAPPKDHESHSTFSNLFLCLESNASSVSITRRSRNADKQNIYAAFTCSDPLVSYCLSRRDALGRGGYRNLAYPSTSTAEGFVIDPCICARVKLSLCAGEEKEVRFALCLGANKSAANEAALRTVMSDSDNLSCRFEETRRLLELSSKDTATALDMLSDMTFITPNHRIGANALQALKLPRCSLWKFGVSGDYPIITSLIPRDCGDNGRRNLETLLRQHLFLFLNGGFCDLILICDDSGDYTRPMYSYLSDCISRYDNENLLDIHAGVHIIDKSSISEDECTLLCASADVIYNPKKGYKPFPRVKHSIAASEQIPDRALAPPDVTYRDESVVFGTKNGLPPLAWSHIITNRSFGYLATDCGAGHMWYYNSRENMINRWDNDPLSSYGPERIYVTCADRRYSVFADGIYPTTVTYGIGYAVWQKTADGLEIKTTAFAHPYFAARILIIEVANSELQSTNSSDSAKCSIEYFTDLTLGSSRSDAKTVITCVDSGTDAIFARNPANIAFGEYVFSVKSFPDAKSYTCDAIEYCGGGMTGSCGAGFVPCIAFTSPLAPDNGAYKAVIVTGCSEDNNISRIAALCDMALAYKTLEEVRTYWRTLCAGPNITKESAPFNNFINGFGLYQVIACRLFGRTSIYQNGGAYGFRDQLQDVYNLLSAPPDDKRYQIVKTQILRSAFHQYEEGDVMHWWHPYRNSIGRGVRTRISDDLLFLPFTVCAYVKTSGDYKFLEQRVPYIHSAPLKSDENDRYEEPSRSKILESVYDHCIRSIECAISRGEGSHGLSLMGTGDWNDGMNAVGEKGCGESVWLTWFFAAVLRDFSQLAMTLDDTARSMRYASQSRILCENAFLAWDGRWFLRGYYDSGATLGSQNDKFCQIDAIAQAFSAEFYDKRAASEENNQLIRTALLSAYSSLVDENEAIVRLFAPSFDRNRHIASDPGYIAAYPIGVRENGGQYTHGAVWLAMAMFRAELFDEGEKIMKYLLPANHDTQEYLGEPYYLAADVYFGGDLTGRSGWTMYTGAAGWYYRAAMENIVGICYENGAEIRRKQTENAAIL